MAPRTPSSEVLMLEMVEIIEDLSGHLIEMIKFRFPHLLCFCQLEA